MRVYGFRYVSIKKLCTISGLAIAVMGAVLHWPELLSLGGLLLAIVRNTDTKNSTGRSIGQLRKMNRPRRWY